MKKLSYWLSLVLVFTIPWDNVVDLPGLGTLNKLIGSLVAAVWVLNVVLTGKMRKPHLFHCILLVFIVWSAITLIWSVDPTRTGARIPTYLQLLILVLMMWDLYTTPKAMQAAMQAYVLGEYVSVYSTIKGFMAGSFSASGDYGRYAAGVFDPNDLGIILALGLPLAWYLATAQESHFKAFRLVNFLYFPAGIGAILLTASRTSLLATFPTFIYAMGTFRKLKLNQQVILLLVLAAGAVALQPLIPASSFERVASTGNEVSGGDFNGRLPIWKQGLTVYLSHTWFGVGCSAYSSVVAAGKVAHNTFVSVLVETGAIGFFLFMSILLYTVYQCILKPKVGIVWLTTLSIWWLGAFTLTWEHRKATWLFFNWPLISAQVIETQERRRFGDALAAPLLPTDAAISNPYHLGDS